MPEPPMFSFISPIMSANLQQSGRASANAAGRDADAQSTLEMCQVMHSENANVGAAVEACLPNIAKAIDLVGPRVARGGRVIYLGAGPGGRYGILEAAEAQSNPSIPPRRFVGQLAGGDVAMRYEAEGVDESIDLGKADLAVLSPPLDPARDTVVGILLPMSSLYVLGGLKFAKDAGCLVLGIARMRIGAIGSICHHVIECNTEGPEMGFKAGLALKMILGMMTDGINNKAITRRRPHR
ncbi:N-acetylmuramic acid 6-phosphate etherase [Lasiodiplodia hormozganensis]|uniref:N-acetylmuramic acid 6-phosphate etherase n=1 Tax=Lasiodiplodia hormozganensis TaxID=869390 RepID=A0AA39Z4E0_9PEZI|nr:N-acetylmuramic acid 6-phosphate etherase [Lasiodiplodia hormozganensis]